MVGWERMAEEVIGFGMFEGRIGEWRARLTKCWYGVQLTTDHVSNVSPKVQMRIFSKRP